MKDMQKINKEMIIGYVRRYHLVIFIVLTVLLLSVAIVLFYRVVDKASGAYSSGESSIPNNFDQETIERIKKLKTSDQPSEPLDMSQGRIDPFNE